MVGCPIGLTENQVALAGTSGAIVQGGGFVGTDDEITEAVAVDVASMADGEAASVPSIDTNKLDARRIQTRNGPKKQMRFTGTQGGLICSDKKISESVAVEVTGAPYRTSKLIANSAEAQGNRRS